MSVTPEQIRQIKLDAKIENPDDYYLLFLANGQKFQPFAVSKPATYKDVINMLVNQFGGGILDVTIDISGTIVTNHILDNTITASEPAIIQFFRRN